ncbi:hypothetical protein EXU57_23835 [Segetibacter sp. 3557_3]|uniref:hypothetical protein n=1 Tax=Segetibacter sp. 3557_3 TaxID=2547429 RepID=UPI0010587DFE|nr:hypothetical protein [Segetibacter sp. 3557_3]TDH18288.1 hypothetical protein EXU57_23835 [Segetibacter sp. 3557_3]
MEAALFIFYVFVCSILLLYLPFFKSSGLKRWIIPIFLLKVGAGFAYARFYLLPKNYPGADTWRFFDQSLGETKLLLRNPVSFFTDLFTHGYARTGNIFAGENSYWNDLKSNFFVKILALLNLLTFNSYYANLVLLNLVFMTGLVALFKTFSRIYPSKELLLALAIFCVPSTLFWCSGVHKDGLVLSALGLVFYFFSKLLQTGRLTILNIVVALLCCILIFFFRNYMLFALVPAIACGWLARCHEKKMVTFLGIYLAGIVLFFLLPLVSPALNLPGVIVTKQQEFLQLQGSSFIETTPLEPTAQSFISFLPAAIKMAFLRPFNIETLSYLPTVVELYAINLLMLLCVLSYKRAPLSSFAYSCLFYGFSILLICGYTIPFVGAVVRYRSIVYPFILPVILMIATRQHTHPSKHIEK